jgi:hypothetical protein
MVDACIYFHETYVLTILFGWKKGGYIPVCYLKLVFLFAELVQQNSWFPSLLQPI